MYLWILQINWALNEIKLIKKGAVLSHKNILTDVQESLTSLLEPTVSQENSKLLKTQKHFGASLLTLIFISHV